MLFNSYNFIFYFLIPVLITFYFLGFTLKANTYRLKLWFLILVSILFYMQWDKIHLILLLGSIVINYFFVKHLVHFYKSHHIVWFYR